MKRFSLWLSGVILLFCGLHVAQAQPAALVFGGDTLLFLEEAKSNSAEVRGILYNYQLKKALESGALPALVDVSVDGDSIAKILLDNKPIVYLFTEDTAVNKASVEDLARELKNRLALPPSSLQENDEIKQKDAVKLILQSVVFIAVLLLCWLIFFIFGKLYRFLKKRWLEQESSKKLNGFKLKNFEFLSKEKQHFFLDLMLKLLRIIFTALFIFLTIPAAFALFPETSHLSGQLLNYVLNPLSKIGGAIIDFMPELVNIALVYILVSYALRFLRYLKEEIAEGKLSVNNFKPEWAKPTYQLLRVLVLMLAALIVLPIFSFASSPLFLGAVGFAALAFALGSGASVANFIAGVQIAFMRPFVLGDFIKVGKSEGEVMDNNLLTTRLKTTQNEIIVIPNSEILKAHTVNYSASTKELGLILHVNARCAVQDVDTVSNALLSAASQTKGVMENPKPFILKQGMENGAFALQLNVYVQQAEKLERYRSALWDNIQIHVLEQGLRLL